MDHTRAPLSVRVYFDFASTLSYVTHRAMQRIAPELEELGIELDWAPLDLVVITGWRRGAPIDGPRRENALRVAAEIGVPVRVPACWPDSRRSNAVAWALGATARGATWRECVFSALHEGNREIESRRRRRPSGPRGRPGSRARRHARRRSAAPRSPRRRDARRTRNAGVGRPDVHARQLADRRHPGRRRDALAAPQVGEEEARSAGRGRLKYARSDQAASLAGSPAIRTWRIARGSRRSKGRARCNRQRLSQIATSPGAHT